MKSLLLQARQILDEFPIEYGDVRFAEHRDQMIVVRDTIPMELADHRSSGFGIRVFYQGVWGFYSTPRCDVDSIKKGIEKAYDMARSQGNNQGRNVTLAPVEKAEIQWKSPYSIDPFTVPLREKVALLKQINGSLLNKPQIKHALSWMSFSRARKLFISTIDSFTDQTITHSSMEYSAMAMNGKGYEERTYQVPPSCQGYESVDPDTLLSEVSRIAREAREKLEAPVCPEGLFDLIMLPNHTALVIHETIGHATELDRVLGWEADFAGTSFATQEKLGSLQYGSDIFNVIGDRTMEKGQATIPYDDDGVPTQAFPIIENGILVGYSTTRDTAPLNGESKSKGCSFADSWSAIPILRMPNVSIQPGGKEGPSLNDIISDTQKGILVDGRGSYSIDQQRINFQFGADFCQLIENGTLTTPVRKMIYQSSNPFFWRNVDIIANDATWRAFGVTRCGKGQPIQIARLTHGSAPLRVKNVQVRGAQKCL